MTRAEALAALAWQVEAGADEAIEDAAINWLAAPPLAEDAGAAVPAAPAANKPTPPPLLTPTMAAGASDAASIAAGCNSVEELRAAIAAFDGCALKATATRMVFADGNPDAPLMIIGEAPGREEDLTGLPFVGAAGKLLDRMLAAIGRDRKASYISNIVFWRPPGNRTPTPLETQACLPFVRRHIALTRPRVLLLLGGPASAALMETTAGITRLRGRWMRYEAEGASIDALATFHPAYLLRQPAQKGLAWRDFLSVAERLEG
ncbi:MAG: uracil-DNA glycosylase [Pseudomonadota bacterium]